MKTAMQELIEKLKAQQKILEKEDSIVLAAALYAGQRMAEELLEKEKEQIIDAYDTAIERPIDNYAEQYYNQTYNKNNMKTNITELIEVRFEGNSITKNMVGFGETAQSHFSLPEEVIKVNAVFFKKPYHKQRAVLRLVIWWAVKRYFKILFK